MQVAAGRALHYAGQLVRRRGKRVTISLPSATTARDLQPTRPGDTRSNTSHRDIARNNSLKLQQLGTHVTMNVDAAPMYQVKYKESASSATLTGGGTRRTPRGTSARLRARRHCHPTLG